MSAETVKAKLQAAEVNYESWMDTEQLQFSSAFHNYSPTEIGVYFGWMKQQKTLYRFLSEAPLPVRYIDELGLEKQAQFERFKDLVSALVYPKLKQHATAIDSLRTAFSVCSFSTVLSDREQDQIQDTVADWMDTFRRQFSEKIAAASSDQQIFNLFSSELNSDFWATLNSFNNRHYRVKAIWLETLIGLVRHPKTSKRLVQAILGKLVVLDMNEEHKKEIAALHQDVRAGKIRLEKTRVPWFRVSLLFGIVVLIVCGLAWMMYLPAEPEQKKEQEETSFMQLSQAERNELDSLLDDYKQKEIYTAEQGDDFYFDPPPSELITLNSSSSELFWRYYKNWKKKEKNEFALSFNPKGNKNKQLPGTLPLKGKKGNLEGYFVNESSLSALVILFDEMNGDFMFCQFVQPKESIKFRINTEVEKLIVVPGGKMNSKLKESELPFSEVNEYFFRQLDRMYTVTDNGQPFKVVYKDLKNNGVVLIDLKKVLSL